MAASRFGQGLLLAGIGGLFVAATPVVAQTSGNGFLFGEPVARFSLHGGFAYAAASGDVFAFTRERLTVDRADFASPLVGAELAVRLRPRLDLALGAGYAGARVDSEFRMFVGTDDLPIEQTTRFDRVPLTASVKGYVAPRGRSVGSLAWIPARVAPYVGVGGGAMWYRFEQEGEFVDFEDLSIFPDVLTTSGWTPTAHAMAGLDFSLSPRFGMSGEARYTLARAEPREAFSGFDSVDLSGLAASIGFHVRF